MTREPFGRRAIATADIADVLAGMMVKCFSKMGNKGFDRLVRSFLAAGPETVMDMLDPDLAVERVEFVIMLRDGSGRLMFPRHDHGKANARCMEPSLMRVKAATCRMREGHVRQR